MRMANVVNVDDKTHRWRWTCPAGHRSWEPTNHHFWCKQCSRIPDLDGSFDELHDKQRGETFQRDELKLVTDAGSYVDVYGKEGRP
jgi:hypothetical protein